jgi:hypothetical protein
MYAIPAWAGHAAVQAAVLLLVGLLLLGLAYWISDARKWVRRNWGHLKGSHASQFGDYRGRR